MNSTMVSVRQLAWHEDVEIGLEFPSSWNVHLCRMRGHDAPALDDAGIRRAFANPIGTRTIKELATGKSEVAIIFDDMSRPTKVYNLVPYVLEELKSAGVPERGIRFVVAQGSHGDHNRHDFVRKLGAEIVDRFAVYNHNPYENCTPLGKTQLGTPLAVNAEVMRCDLKIGIGSLLPHPLAGYGGGAKIVLPGIAAIESIAYNHDKARWGSGPNDRHPSIGLNKHEGNILRNDFNEAARMAGLDIKVDGIINARRDPVRLLVGDVIAAHETGVPIAREHYRTEPPGEVDIVVANAYSRANEATLSAFGAAQFFGPDGGAIVLLMNCPEGQVVHRLAGKWGKWTSGRSPHHPHALPPKVKRMIIMSPRREHAGFFGEHIMDQIEFVKTWPEVLELLRSEFPNQARVAVIPDSTIQYFG